MKQCSYAVSLALDSTKIGWKS